MGTEWRQLAVPPICERMIGFSVPKGDVVLVVSYEGMHLIHLSEPITVTTDEDFAEYDCYDPHEGVADYDGNRWNIIGLYKGEPILRSPQGEELRLDNKRLKISVLIADRVTWSSDFENFSGDWAAATFSPDGTFVVLGCPYDFDFRVWRRTID